jgi:hypothetical protein
MTLAGVAAEVTVSGATPAIDPRKTVTGATFPEKELQQVPSARNVWATLWQVPGVVSNQVNVGGNTAVQANPVSKGVSGPTYNLEGSDITLGGLSPTFYNFDSFQEVQIVTGGSDITLLNGGATFNMAVKRGTNSIHGSARYFYAPDRWQADNTPPEVNVEELTPNRTNVLRDYGIEAGGTADRGSALALGRMGQEQHRPAEGGAAGHRRETGQQQLRAREFRRPPRRSARGVRTRSSSTTITETAFSSTAASIPTRRPKAAFDLTQPVPIYKVEDTQIFSPSLTASAFFSYMDFAQTATPVGGLDAQVYLDPDFIQRGSTLFAEALGIVRPGRRVRLEFFTAGSFSHELKFGFGYRQSTNSSQTVWPGDQVLADAATATRSSRARVSAGIANRSSTVTSATR